MPRYDELPPAALKVRSRIMFQVFASPGKSTVRRGGSGGRGSEKTAGVREPNEG